MKVTWTSSTDSLQLRKKLTLSNLLMAFKVNQPYEQCLMDWPRWREKSCTGKAQSPDVAGARAGKCLIYTIESNRSRSSIEKRLCQVFWNNSRVANPFICFQPRRKQQPEQHMNVKRRRTQKRKWIGDFSEYPTPSFNQQQEQLLPRSAKSTVICGEGEPLPYFRPKYTFSIPYFTPDSKCVPYTVQTLGGVVISATLNRIYSVRDFVTPQIMCVFCFLRCVMSAATWYY